MDRKVLDRMTVPIVAVCILVACSPSTTTTPGPTTAFAVTRFTTAGALDTTFAAGKGVAITDINPGLFDFAVAVAVQPVDNKIIAAGSSGFAGAGIIALIRHNADGTLDTTGFGTAGTGGIVTTPTPTGWTSASATAIAVQPADSKIVVAAVAFNATTSSTGILLLRYTTTGTLDPSFGTTGSAIILPVGSGFPGDTCGLVLQPDGKPVVVGASSDGKIILARYTTLGVLDTTFGDGNSGITTTNLNTVAGDGNIGLSPSIGLQSGGQIIVASVVGRSSTPPANHVVLRYGTNGALDTTFGGVVAAGIVITDVGGAGNVDFPSSVAVQGSETVQGKDKIVVAGHANVNVNAGFSDISLVRYNADGTLDTGFGSSGTVITDLGGFDGVFSIALQAQPPAEPKILVSGNVSSGAFAQLAVLRYNPDGTPDTTFDANGVASAPLVGPSNISSGNAVALQAVGGGVAIVVAGYD